jgi:hypothetical protein
VEGRIPANATAATLTLGLEQVSGIVSFDHIKVSLTLLLPYLKRDSYFAPRNIRRIVIVDDAFATVSSPSRSCLEIQPGLN